MDTRTGLDDTERRKIVLLSGLKLRPICRPALASRSTDCAIPSSTETTVTCTILDIGGERKRTSERHIACNQRVAAQRNQRICMCLYYCFDLNKVRLILVIAQSVQGLASGKTAEGSEFESRSGQDLSPLHVVQTGSGDHPIPIQRVLGAFSPGIKRPGRDADHLPPTSAEVINTWIYTSTPPYIFTA
jgi:hypothetical protein